jgi:biotin synthase
MIIEKCIERIKNGENIDFELAYELATTTHSDELFEAADHIRRYLHGNAFDLCSIINAKSGRCSEDCRFCAQSSHYDADIETYDIIAADEALLQGKDNHRHKVGRFSLVTAGKTVSLEDLQQFGKIYKELGEKTELQFCASMGLLTREKAELLKSFGVERYHCNLETCRRYFPSVCTTHTWEEKVETIRIAKEAGLEVCSGGIIGMGESLEHRLELAFELRDLEILSIPINVLTPIANTPFESLAPLSLSEILTCIAVFRFINPHAVVRLAGGRAQLGDDQYQCFTSGANGAIVGNYLTTAGNSLANDLLNIEKCGFTFKEGGNE